MHRYVFHGLSVRSQISFPELDAIALDDSGAADLIIRLASIDDVPQSPVNAEGYHVQGTQAFFVYPGVGRFLAREGCELIVEPAPGANLDHVRLFVLGSGLGAILHQRGVLPLHASAVAYGGRCYGFLGSSGAGKSTTAAMLADRGFDILSDDVLAVTADTSDGTARALPGIPLFKLSPATARISGFTDAQANYEIEPQAKYRIGAPTQFTDKSRPIARIYALMPLAPVTAPLECECPTAIQAMQTIRDNIYRGSLIASLGREEFAFKTIHALVRQAPIYAFRRPMSLDALARQIDFLEDHIKNHDDGEPVR